MSMNYREVGQPHVARYGEGVRRMNEFADSLVEQGLLPQRFPETQPMQIETEIYPEIPLEAEIERLARRYQELGFHEHKNIKMSKGKFKDSIMKLVAPQPENFKGRVDSPAVVFGQIPIGDQYKLAGINYLLTGLNVRDWPDDPKQYSTPQAVHIIWTDEGARNMNRKVEDVRRELALDTRGGTEFDAIGLYVATPKVLQVRFLDLPGTAVESGFAPSLNVWDGQPRLYGRWVIHAIPRFGSLVCGRQK